MLLSFKLVEDRAGLLLLLLLGVLPKRKKVKTSMERWDKKNLRSSIITGEEVDEIFLNFLLELSSSCCLQSLVQTKLKKQNKEISTTETPLQSLLFSDNVHT